MDKTAFAKIYLDLVKAGRRTEDSVPEQLKAEYNTLKEADTSA
ncbi:CD1375 family protein [Paenibacillus vini]|uniref:Uncharacterized protein n=1 Tax=Paenibacillus vini TaxID=1476024 RepID=A0ABQ4MJK8_9BACL|nr:CD1375 family protein [Paenibacillus vini]GIP56173.1 hypothetical protein J42TS3_52080 [Paenibacillus vini]